MNVNEVIANRAIQLLGGELGSKDARPPQRPRQHGPVVQRHLPDGHAHRRGARSSTGTCCPAGASCIAARSRRKAAQWADVVKIGRTHLEDAVPLTVGQEWSGWAHSSDPRRTGSSTRLEPGCTSWPLGGTAVGTGLNAPPRASAGEIAAEIADAHRAIRSSPRRTSSRR